MEIRKKICFGALLLSLGSILVLPVHSKAAMTNRIVKNHNYISSKDLSSSTSENLNLYPYSYRTDANDIVILANYRWDPLPSYRKTDAFSITYDKSKFTLSKATYTDNYYNSKGDYGEEVHAPTMEGPGYISCFAPLKIDDSYATMSTLSGCAIIYLHSNDANVPCTANIYYSHMTSGNFGVYVPTSNGLNFTGDGMHTEYTTSTTVQ
ncbi:hypothetical protein [Clostridium felsineum]|uniref:Uncharacterized protein n=1 Tax=Clostridium felsineum TaxID=36839 RepID=A0A1S8L3F8_9CLOT|nr:hypothetical protein [Clostridium felsineum]URZ08950.1 hypothetical protein CLROS_043540 [Clostridium felsineum]URZ09578.1 hypothetical protein CROST_002590 [Clostridium felsineum]